MYCTATCALCNIDNDKLGGPFTETVNLLYKAAGASQFRCWQGKTVIKHMNSPSASLVTIFNSCLCCATVFEGVFISLSASNCAVTI